jgi:kinesin family protein C1
VESELRALKLKYEESQNVLGSKEQAIKKFEEEVAKNAATIEALEAKIREEEMIRRKLHNTIQVGS